MEQEYKDPKDLRDIPLDRLRYEGNLFAKQYNEWNDLFSIESAIRKHEFSDLEKWSILSSRYLLMEREHLSDYKLFTKSEVLAMIKEAYIKGWQDRRFSSEEDKDQHEHEQAYMEKVSGI
jgi:hypothetical protein